MIDHELALENKRVIESEMREHLEHGTPIKFAGPKEYWPEVPEHLRGHLLKGMRGVRPSETGKAAAKRKHMAAVRAGFLAPDVKVRYLDSGNYEVDYGS